MKKICTKCKEEKDLCNFSFKDKVNEKLQAQCKTCVADRDRKSYSSEERKKSIRKAAKVASTKIKNYIESYKKENVCSKCGEDRFYVLDFHHLGNKEYDIALAHARGISIEKLKEEIDKCVLLCANCHRELHYLERQNAGIFPRPDKALKG